MNDSLDGFYAGYFAASGGEGLAMLVFKGGLIVGCDPSGTTFDGSYQAKEGGSGFIGKVDVSAPPAGKLIQGVDTGELGLKYSVQFELPNNFIEQQFIRMITPFGPVNVKLTRLRALS